MPWIVILLVLGGWWLLRVQEQRQRIQQLAGLLAPYNLEQLMQTVMDGYLRAFGESDAQRRHQVLSYLQAQEGQLSAQMQSFATDVLRLPAEAMRISLLPVSLPFASRWWSASSVDARKLFAIHASGVALVVDNAAGREERDRAYMASAELLLFQHSCHWYCRSRALADARLMARHQTRYEQVLGHVNQATREAYLALLQR